MEHKWMDSYCLAIKNYQLKHGAQHTGVSRGARSYLDASGGTVMRNWRHILNLGAMLTVAAFVRIWNSWSPSLSLDEFATYWVVASKSYSELWERCTHYLAHSPSSTLFSVRVSYECLGKSEFALRLPTVLAGVFSAYLAFVLGCKYGSALSGTLAGWIMTLHPWFILFSQQARPYASQLRSLCSQPSSLRNVLSRQGTKQALGFSLSSALLIYTHFLFGLFVSYFQSAYWLIFIIFNGDMRRHGRLWGFVSMLHSAIAVSRRRPRLTLFGRAGKLSNMKLTCPQVSCWEFWRRTRQTHTARCSLWSCWGSYPVSYSGELQRFHSGTARQFASQRPCNFFIWYMVPWLFYGLLCWVAKTSSFLNLRYLIVYLIAGNFLYIWIHGKFPFGENEDSMDYTLCSFQLQLQPATFVP